MRLWILLSRCEPFYCQQEACGFQFSLSSGLRRQGMRLEPRALEVS